MKTQEDDSKVLASLRYVLDMTDCSDWHLIHNTARKYVQDGILSKSGEIMYSEIVDNMLKVRFPDQTAET